MRGGIASDTGTSRVVLACTGAKRRYLIRVAYQQRDLAFAVAEDPPHEPVDVVRIVDVELLAEPRRERLRGLLRALGDRRIDRVDARADVDVGQELREQLGAL